MPSIHPSNRKSQKIPFVKIKKKHIGVSINIECPKVDNFKTDVNHSCTLYSTGRKDVQHGGESRDILLLYSDRTSKNIRHYF